MKTIILDQDGTLYPERSELTYELRKRTKEWLSESLMMEKDKVEELYHELPGFYPNPFDGFMSLGLEISDYHKEVFEKVDVTEFISRDVELIGLLEKIERPIYIVTLASKDYSRRLQEGLGIHSLIEKTYFVSDFLPKTSKSIPYMDIAQETGVNHKDIYVVGNNFETDIKPGLDNGFMGVLIGSDPRVKGFFSIYPVLDYLIDTR